MKKKILAGLLGLMVGLAAFNFYGGVQEAKADGKPTYRCPDCGGCGGNSNVKCKHDVL